MSNKSSESTQTISDEFKDQSSKHNLNKFEYDLYHEEDDISFKVVRVKHISLPNKGDKWKIFEDNKVVNSIDGKKLTNKEKEFLKTTDGIIWLLEMSKLGINSFNSFKKDLKKKIAG